MMDLLFYVIIIVVVILKLIFWIFYFYARNRRRLIAQALRQHSQQQIPQGRQYEEEPAVPQPAYVFTEYPFGVNGVPSTFQNPPVYSVEDPVKLDEPPPPYLNDEDTGRLIENQEN